MGSVPFTMSDLQLDFKEVQSSPTLLCTPLMGTTVDQMLIEMQRAKEIGADVVEIRIDCLKNLNPRQDLEILIKQSPLPTLVTYRPTWEGGQYDGDEIKRQDALRLAMQLGANCIDIELEVAYDFNNSISRSKPDNFKVIVSSHNFHNTPSAEAIASLVARIQATGADIVKIATTALDITDCARIFQIMVHSQVPIIGIAMGERGLISRLLSPKFGGFLSYGALEAGAISAPGQPTAKDMLDLYNFRLMRPDTKVYGIIGKPVGHSKSPLLFNASFKSVGLNAVYMHFLVDDVEKFFNTYSSVDFTSGCSCTIPHKEVALKCMDEIDPIAKSIGAVNTIIRRPGDGKLIGYNTDSEASLTAMEDALKEQGYINSRTSFSSSLTGRQFVLVGAGGAGRALAFGAKSRGARVIIFDVDFERAKSLAHGVSGEAQPFESLVHFQPENGAILANATPLGMHPNTDRIPVAEETLGIYQLVFDAVYTPRKTRLLKEAEAAGAIIVSGVEMFFRQAIGQFNLFTGREAPKDFIREIVLAKF
ncbi:bifunctional 3-dehydroquinate dehydratase/shikimate dehydrogenase, chloroplastic-like [Hevea brasiliensis]|nr:bifunctional 3-dehydroquinate dehydratase/shikimate dehydrogenase, chloroplastic-like [Hevea brasiliensis]